MYLEREFLQFIQKYNPNLWVFKDDSNSAMEVVSEDEYYKRLNQETESEDEEVSPESYPPIENPYLDMELNEAEGIENFDRELLQKGRLSIGEDDV